MTFRELLNELANLTESQLDLQVNVLHEPTGEFIGLDAMEIEEEGDGLPVGTPFLTFQYDLNG